MTRPGSGWSTGEAAAVAARFTLRFSPVLGAYLPEGFAACPRCEDHIQPRLRPAPAVGVVLLDLACPTCGTRLECGYREVALGRLVPAFRCLTPPRPTDRDA